MLLVLQLSGRLDSSDKPIPSVQEPENNALHTAPEMTVEKLVETLKMKWKEYNHVHVVYQNGFRDEDQKPVEIALTATKKARKGAVLYGMTLNLQEGRIQIKMHPIGKMKIEAPEYGPKDSKDKHPLEIHAEQAGFNVVPIGLPIKIEGGDDWLLHFKIEEKKEGEEQTKEEDEEAEDESIILY